MTTTRKHITSNIEVWSGYARELGDNGKQGDSRMSLRVAPATKGDDQYVYVETNGDPILIGWLYGDDLELAEGVSDCLDAADMRWVNSILNNTFVAVI